MYCEAHGVTTQILTHIYFNKFIVTKNYLQETVFEFQFILWSTPSSSFVPFLSFFLCRSSIQFKFCQNSAVDLIPHNQSSYFEFQFAIIVLLQNLNILKYGVGMVLQPQQASPQVSVASPQLSCACHIIIFSLDLIKSLYLHPGSLILIFFF